MIFRDKTVIVTGGSEGIGAATARLFAEAGANLVLVARNKKNLESVAEDLRETKDTIARHESNLKKYERNERQIIERFDKDISRFKILKGIDEPQAAVAERTALVTP